MPTAASFVPVLGSFDAPFSIVSGDGTDVPRNGGAALQGTPRPGVLKTAFDIVCPDPTANNDDTYDFFVASPYAFTAALLNTEANRFRPIYWVQPEDAASAAQGPLLSLFAPAGWSEANQAIRLSMTVTTPAAAAVIFRVFVDFSHTAIS